MLAPGRFESTHRGEFAVNLIHQDGAYVGGVLEKIQPETLKVRHHWRTLDIAEHSWFYLIAVKFFNYEVCIISTMVCMYSKFLTTMSKQGLCNVTTLSWG